MLCKILKNMMMTIKWPLEIAKKLFKCYVKILKYLEEEKNGNTDDRKIGKRLYKQKKEQT
jgi:hypothetical protein